MGAPIGNKNAAKAKVWAAAIERALDKRGAGDRLAALNDLAEKLLMKCDEGDMTALKELGDRLDGRPVQAVEATGAEGGPMVFRVELVAMSNANGPDSAT